MWPAFVPAVAVFANSWPKSRQNRLNPPDSCSKRAGIGEHRSTQPMSGLTSIEKGESLVEHGQAWPQSARIWSKFDRDREIGPNPGQLAEIGRISFRITQIWWKAADELGAQLSRIHTHVVESRPLLAKSDHTRSKWPRCRNSRSRHDPTDRVGGRQKVCSGVRWACRRCGVAPRLTAGPRQIGVPSRGASLRH